jgi:membrane protein required for colicin V production
MALDILVVLVLLFGLLRGWSKGLISVILSIVFLVLAMYGAGMLGGWVGDSLKINPAYLSRIVGFMIAFGVLYMIGRLIRNRIKPKSGILGGADKLAGAALGLVRGLLVLSIALVFLRVIHLPPESMRTSSRLYPHVVSIAPSLVKLLRPITSSDRLEV